MSSAGTRAKLGPLCPPALLVLVLAGPQGRRDQDVLCLQDTLNTFPGMARSQPETPAVVQEGLHTSGAGGLLAGTQPWREGVLMPVGALQGWGDRWLEQKWWLRCNYLCACFQRGL